MILEDLQIPETLKHSAEQVRAHLVFLRGGAPFLSPADGLCLLDWLEREVPVPVILMALERCVESRRRNKAKRRLTLRAAKRHLYKAPLTPPALAHSDGHPFSAVSEVLDGLEDAADLCDALTSLPTEDREHLVTEAVGLCRDEQERRWADISETERRARVATARDELGDLANLVDADTLDALAEEVARDSFRALWPRLDTATFSALATP